MAKGTQWASTRAAITELDRVLRASFGQNWLKLDQLGAIPEHLRRVREALYESFRLPLMVDGGRTVRPELGMVLVLERYGANRRTPSEIYDAVGSETGLSCHAISVITRHGLYSVYEALEGQGLVPRTSKPEDYEERSNVFGWAAIAAFLEMGESTARLHAKELPIRRRGRFVEASALDLWGF